MKKMQNGCLYKYTSPYDSCITYFIVLAYTSSRSYKVTIVYSENYDFKMRPVVHCYDTSLMANKSVLISKGCIDNDTFDA